MKKILYILIVAIVILFLDFKVIDAAEVDTQTTQIVLQQLDLFDWESIQSLEDSLKQSSPYMQDFDLTNQVIKLATGQERFSLESVLLAIGNQFIQEIEYYVRIIIRFILIVILCGFLQTLTNAFKSKEITKIAFFVCYLLIIYTISQSLFVIVDLAVTTISRLSEMILVTLPTLLAFMAVSGYITSSSALAPIMLSVINMMTFVIQHLILPVVVSIIVLQIISSLSEEIKLDKFVNLFYKTVRWGLRGIFIVSVAIMSIYRMTLPTLDVALKKGALNFSSAFIPVVGDAGKGALEFMMACANLAKNSFAIGVIIWIILIAAIPLIKIFAYVALYHVAGAVIQPIGNKKMCEIASILAKGCEFILSCVGSVVILAVVVMVVCTSIGMSIA